MTKDELIDYFNTFENSSVDCPFEDDDSIVARHKSNKKWYALIMCLSGRYVVNLKCDPLQSQFLRDNYKSIYPAYHMNKVHWNTVELQGDASDELIKNLVNHSFELTMSTKKSKRDN